MDRTYQILNEDEGVKDNNKYFTYFILNVIGCTVNGFVKKEKVEISK